MRHILKISLLLLVMAFLTTFYIIYCIFTPVKTLVIKNFSFTDPVHIKTPVVHPGDFVKYDLDYCKYTHLNGAAHRVLVDGQQIVLTNNNSSTSLLYGCHLTERQVTIPDTVNPGRYYLNLEIDYPVNVFRTERIYYYTEYFQVVGQDMPSTSEPDITTLTPAIPSPQEALGAIMNQ